MPAAPEGGAVLAEFGEQAVVLVALVSGQVALDGSVEGAGQR
ncbi:hypothetical protein ACFWJY_16555 [Streptomyces anulatus]